MERTENKELDDMGTHIMAIIVLAVGAFAVCTAIALL